MSDNRPTCFWCGDKAPYGDERMVWLRVHNSWWHRTWRKLTRRVKGGRTRG